MIADVTMVARLPTESLAKCSAISPTFWPTRAIAARTPSGVRLMCMNGTSESIRLADASNRWPSAVRSLFATQCVMPVTIWPICRTARKITPPSGMPTMAIVASRVSVADSPTFIRARNRL